MKRILFATIFIFILCSCRGISQIPLPTLAPTPGLISRLDRITISSRLLEKDMHINVYVPKGYSTSAKYPVLYAIHGYNSNQNMFMPDLGLDKRLDSLIDNNKISPMLVVAPEIDRSFGLDSSEKPGHIGTNLQNSVDTGMYEDYIIKELIPYIDGHYSTINNREGRYIGGISMGGYAALYLAFRHTDLFSKAGGHSPALFNEKSLGNKEVISWLYPDDKSRNERDPLYLAKHADLSNLKVYLDCGSKDDFRFYDGSQQLYSILKSKNINVEYHLSPGGHDPSYWESNLDNYLAFYDAKP